MWARRLCRRIKRKHEWVALAHARHSRAQCGCLSPDTTLAYDVIATAHTAPARFHRQALNSMPLATFNLLFTPWINTSALTHGFSAGNLCFNSCCFCRNRCFKEELYSHVLAVTISRHTLQEGTYLLRWTGICSQLINRQTVFNTASTVRMEKHGMAVR